VVSRKVRYWARCCEISLLLRVPIPPDSALTCCADDTLVLVLGSTWGRTVRLAELAGAYAVAAIQGLGLEVSPEKSETM
jgi:hypothetical protein